MLKTEGQQEIDSAAHKVRNWKIRYIAGHQQHGQKER